MKHVLGALLGAASLLISVPSIAQTTLTIATVNNSDMIRMQGLTTDFTTKNPDIAVKWVTLEENVLRQRVTTDIATKGGQFDVQALRRAVLWRELDDHLSHRPVREGRIVDAGKPDLGFRGERREEAH